jgi:nucleotide-binding universal stress UspA family protein
MGEPCSHILVPLDGSKTAEAALPKALALAKMSGAQVTLLMIVPLVETVISTDAEPIYIDEQVNAEKTHALRYLERIRVQIGPQPFRLTLAVETGNAAGAILDYAATHAVDLIAMTTHGRSGLQRWVLGSVAEKIVRAADRPVLLIRAAA